MKKVMISAVILSFGCGLLISSANSFLKERIEKNRRQEFCKRILSTLAISDSEPESRYLQLFEKAFVFSENQIQEITPASILAKEFKAKHFLLIPKNSGQFVCHIFGKGLWGEMLGFATLDQDFLTLKGLSFYQSNETPGLGAQFTEEKTLSRFVGKKVDPKKFAVLNTPGVRNEFTVDGISGATITGKAVERMLKVELDFYRQRLGEVSK